MKLKSGNGTDSRDLEARLRRAIEKELRKEIEKDVRMSVDEEIRQSVVEDVRTTYTEKIEDLEQHMDGLEKQRRALKETVSERNEQIAENEQHITELERQINSADMKRVFIHNDFRLRLFEVFCEIAIEQMEFSNVTRQTLIEERMLHLTQKNPLYKSAKEARRKEMLQAAEEEAMYFYDTHYKAHGLFILYGDVFSVLKEDHSKAMTVSDREERLLESMVPSNVFISEEGPRTTLQRLAPMDGAICIDTFGTIQAAGRYIIVNREISSKITPYTGFGSKNITAQGITSELHNVSGITLSGRSKLVRLFENGEVIKTFEPETGKLSSFKNRVLTEQYYFDANNYFIRSEEADQNYEILNAILRGQFKRGAEAKVMSESFVARLKALFGHPWQVKANFHLRDGKELGITLENVNETAAKASASTKRGRKAAGGKNKRSARGTGNKGTQEVLRVEAKTTGKKGAGKENNNKD